MTLALIQMITLHVIRRSLRPKGDGNGTRLGLDSRAFAERGHCALRSDDTEARLGYGHECRTTRCPLMGFVFDSV
jgi:hypothetical protein